MPRNPMRQVQEVPKPLGIGLAILFNVFPTLCSTHHRTHRNDEDIHQEMTAIGGKGTAGGRQRGKMLMKRRGHAHTHKEAFSPCQGLQMVKLPDHCSGKLSQLLNALALAEHAAKVLVIVDDEDANHRDAYPLRDCSSVRRML